MEAKPATRSAIGEKHIAIVCSRFNEFVVKALLDGALTALRDHGISDDNIHTVWVPGAFELPLAAKQAAMKPNVAAVVCLGAVIKGETPHFDYVSQAAALGILQAGLDSGKPVAFGVLTTNTPEQAFERAGGRVGNKGNDAALAALEMIATIEKIGGLPTSAL